MVDGAGGIMICWNPPCFCCCGPLCCGMYDADMLAASEDTPVTPACCLVKKLLAPRPLCWAGGTSVGENVLGMHWTSASTTQFCLQFESMKYTILSRFSEKPKSLWSCFSAVKRTSPPGFFGGILRMAPSPSTLGKSASFT